MKIHCLAPKLNRKRRLVRRFHEIVRFSLSGNHEGPSIREIMMILGKEETIRRLDAALNFQEAPKQEEPMKKLLRVEQYLRGYNPETELVAFEQLLRTSKTLFEVDHDCWKVDQDDAEVFLAKKLPDGLEYFVEVDGVYKD